MLLRYLTISFLILFCLSGLVAQQVEYGCDIVKTSDDGNSLEASESILLLPPSGTTAALFQNSGFYATIVNHNSVMGNYNYSMVSTVLVDGIKTNSDVDKLAVTQCLREISFLDDIGRNIQEVKRGYSPNQKDYIQPHQYDGSGREQALYLPYASSEGCGLFRTNALSSGGSYQNSEQYLFYNDNSNNNRDKIANDNYPYSPAVYEPSPLNRVIQKFSPGNSFAGTQSLPSAQQHGNTISYRLNSANEVLLFTYSYTNKIATAGVPGSPVYFPANNLTVTQTVNEQGMISVIYSDIEGKKVYTKKSISSGFLETYYIYNDLNQLCFELTPEGVKAGILSLSVSDANTKTYAYAFSYDQRGRKIQMQEPGGKVTNYIYDKFDRPVLTQDANQMANHQWHFVKFDKFGREILTGITTASASATQTTIQNEINTNSVFYEQRIAGGNFEGYSENAYPNSTSTIFNLSNSNLLSVVYYDDYDFNNDGAADYSFNSSINVNGYTTPVAFLRNDGMPIAQKIRNDVSPTNWLINVNYYDRFNRLIQTQKNNHMYLSNNSNPGSTLFDNNTMFYNYIGSLLKIYSYRYITSASTSTVQKRFTYDHAARVTATYHQVGSQPEVQLGAYQYNELGQLVDKKLHSEDNGNNFLQSVDFRYQINGWLTSINNSTLTADLVSNDETNDLFGMEFVYDGQDISTGAGTYANTPRYDGLISAAKWKTANVSNPSGNVNERCYFYSYDIAGRLSGSQYAERSSGSTYWSPAGNAYAENNITYDNNGNIKSLSRYDKSGVLMDNLSYSYSGNYLMLIKDAGSLTSGFRSNSQAQTMAATEFNTNPPPAYPNANQQYTYDNNGNLLTDVNKGITSITYNYMNQALSMAAGGITLQFQYDAAGTMLRKTVTSGTVTTVTDYLDDYIYINNIQQYVNTGEGRAVLLSGSYTYVYDLTDNQGNVRVSFDKGTSGIASVVQEDHYYAYGMRHGEAPTYVTSGFSQNFLYSGKELISEVGLYDFGARMYDPATGRWFVQDPEHQYSSPYAFCANNPVNRIDLDGKKDQWWVVALDAISGHLITQGRYLIKHPKVAVAIVVIVVAVAVTVVTYGLAGGAAAGISASIIAGSAGGAVAAGGSAWLVEHKPFIQVLESMGVGALAGAAGGAIGGAFEDFFIGDAEVAGDEIIESEFWAGVTAGSIGGSTGGFIQGFMDPIVSDQKGNLGYDLKSGLFGFAVGGFIGSLSGMVEGIDFLKGDEDPFDVEAAKQANFKNSNKVAFMKYTLDTNPAKISFYKFLKLSLYENNLGGNIGGSLFENGLDTFSESFKFKDNFNLKDKVIGKDPDGEEE